MGIDEGFVIDRLLLLIPLLVSLSIHEWAHAWSAWRLGDDTAALLGRLTINPAAHIDPIGTLLLPLLGVPFGWAKPVPVNPLRFRRDVSMRKGMMITAAAGPASNVVLALISVVVLAVVLRFGPDDLIARVPVLLDLLRMFLVINVVLATFNLLPIPPLDGSRIVDGIIPQQLRPAWERFMQMGPIALMAVILLPMLVRINLFSWPIGAARWLLNMLLRLLGA